MLSFKQRVAGTRRGIVCDPLRATRPGDPCNKRHRVRALPGLLSFVISRYNSSTHQTLWGWVMALSVPLYLEELVPLETAVFTLGLEKTPFLFSHHLPVCRSFQDTGPRCHESVKHLS